MRLASFQQRKPIFFRTFKGPLMRADDARLKVFNLERGKKSCPAIVLPVFECELLRVAIEAWLRIRLYDVLGQPGLKSLGCSRIGVFGVIEIQMCGVYRDSAGGGASVALD